MTDSELNKNLAESDINEIDINRRSSTSSSCSSKSVDSLQMRFKNDMADTHLRNIRCLAMDIGGSLVKIAYSSSYEKKMEEFAEDDSDRNVYSVNKFNKQVPTINFHKFETKYIESALDYIHTNLMAKEFMTTIKATGGGAHKYRDLIEQKLNVSVEKEDELTCLVQGCNFLVHNVPNEMFTIDYDTCKYEFKNMGIGKEKAFPYLLVSVGSGVSIIKVNSDDSFQRVGGSTIGGSTLWGLGSLLTDAKCFDEIIELAQRGDNSSVDMLVKDIYGGNYEALGFDLSGDLIASTLGKTTRSRFDKSNSCSREEYLKHFKQEDLAKSILLMICYNLSQLSTLYARLHGITKIIFGGYFINDNESTMKYLTYGISYWSQKSITCYFMRHEGYLGAFGAFLKLTEPLGIPNYTWYENFAHSSAYKTTHNQKKTSSTLFDSFELNQVEQKLVMFPFVRDPSNYVADLVDLTKDEEARDYWLDCFNRTIETYVKQCLISYCYFEADELTKAKRAIEFKDSYLKKLAELKRSPFAYGMLTVRSLLDLREHCMSESKFVDVYLNEKREENRLGLELLENRLAFIDKIADREQKWYELFKGVLAGNVYDYGAHAFIQKLEKGDLNHFDQALNSIDENLQHHEDFQLLLAKLLSNAYKCVCIFVDNSGFDVILGILPLTIEFLSNGTTKVILCANSKAAINDITHGELMLIIKKACLFNNTLNECLKNERLLIYETGSASPCLDLSRIDMTLADTCVEQEVDLIILEGMGRSIHTNLRTRFKCDCLKTAVIKNKWLADRLKDECVKDMKPTCSNGFLQSKFPVIFKFEPAEVSSASK